MRRLLVFALCTTLALSPAVIHAQQPPTPPTVVPDDSAAAGAMAGKAAGSKAQLDGTMTALGAVSLLAVPKVGPAVVLGAFAARPSKMPPKVADLLTGHGADYQKAFRDAWNQKTVARQRKKYWVGLGVAGAAVSAFILLVFSAEGMG